SARDFRDGALAPATGPADGGSPSGLGAARRAFLGTVPASGGLSPSSWPLYTLRMISREARERPTASADVVGGTLPPGPGGRPGVTSPATCAIRCGRWTGSRP